MDCMDSRQIMRMIESFAGIEPPFSSLGAPFLADTEETNAVVACGEAALMPLLAALGSDNPKVVMYAAYCLGTVGDDGARESLHRLVQAQERKKAKGPWDYAILS